MSHLKSAALSAVAVMFTCEARAVEATQMDTSKTTYGERNSSSPSELRVFFFPRRKVAGNRKDQA